MAYQYSLHPLKKRYGRKAIAAVLGLGFGTKGACILWAMQLPIIALFGYWKFGQEDTLVSSFRLHGIPVL